MVNWCAKRKREDNTDKNVKKAKLSTNSIYSKDNKIYFRSRVSNDSIDTLIKLIYQKNKEFEEAKRNPIFDQVTAKPIHLHITTYGGSLLAGFRGMDAIKRSKIPIYTVVDGHVASAGTLMSIVGEKRYMTPHSYYLIHQLSTWSGGKFEEIKDEFENCDMWMTEIIELFNNNSKMSKSEIEEQLKHDSWWKIETCLEKGVIDEVYQEIS